jgi:hypothetical protein
MKIADGGEMMKLVAAATEARGVKVNIHPFYFGTRGSVILSAQESGDRGWVRRVSLGPNMRFPNEKLESNAIFIYKK